ncbi:hypothetical protein ACG7TL_006122 [Trametes sanguinea]
MVVLKIKDLQAWLNARNADAQKGKSRTLVTDSQCFTFVIGLQLWEEQEAAWKQKEAALQAKKQLWDQHGFASKSHEDLLDIAAAALGLKLTAPKLTKDILKASILEHFDPNLCLQDDEHF